MRRVSVSRIVPATVREVERALAPANLVEYEGSFEVFGVEEAADAVLVTAGARGFRMTLRFEEREDGWHYEQEGEAGPFDEMWTQVAVEPEAEATRVTMRSAVSLGLPLATVTDRVAAWKRRSELNRALEGLAAEFE